MWVRRDIMAPPEMLCEHRIMDWLSLNQGVMNLSEKFGGTAFAEVYFDELVGHMVKRLREFDIKNKISEKVTAGQIQMLSTSGTLTLIKEVKASPPCPSRKVRSSARDSRRIFSCASRGPNNPMRVVKKSESSSYSLP